MFIHGSGPLDRDETFGGTKPFADLAYGLATRGIATLRYDKRTFAHRADAASAQTAWTIDLEQVDDACSAIALAKTVAEVDATSVLLLGHSLGGMLLPRIAGRCGGTKGWIAVAAPARPLQDVMAAQIAYLASLTAGPGATTPGDRVARVRAQAARISAGDFDADTPAAELLGAPASYWVSLRDYHPLAEAASAHLPMLFMQGARDYQSTPADLELWRAALEGSKDVAFKIYPNLNHFFAEGYGMATPTEYLHATHVSLDAVQDIADWIQANTHRAHPPR